MRLIFLFLFVAKIEAAFAGWSQQTIPTSSFYANSLFFLNSTTGWAIGALPGGYDTAAIFRTTNGGTSWYRQDIGQELAVGKQIQFAGADTGWAVLNSGLFLRTIDGGVNWVYADTLPYEAKFHFFDNVHGIAIGTQYLSSYNLFRTDDGGASWNRATTNPVFPISSICFTNIDTGWAVGTNKIYRTNDGGNTWALQKSLPYETIYDVQFVTPNVGWATATHGVFLRTQNGGTDWEQCAMANSNDLYALYFVDADTGWIVGSYGAIWHTVDGGQTWAGQDIGTLPYLYAAFFVNGNTGWVAGRGVYKTTDGGNTAISRRITSGRAISATPQRKAMCLCISSSIPVGVALYDILGRNTIYNLSFQKGSGARIIGTSIANGFFILRARE